MTLRLFQDDQPWMMIRDADPLATSIFNRHYSRRNILLIKTKKFIGPGEHQCLITTSGDALFVWRKFISKNNQTGINCAIFRNEGASKSSDLILAAEKIAWARWPGERLYTYVNPRKIKSTNPGYCFKKAGWRTCGITKKRRYIILEKIL